MTYPGEYGEMCIHKQPTRFCEICELQDEVKRLKAELVLLRGVVSSYKAFMEGIQRMV